MTVKRSLKPDIDEKKLGKNPFLNDLKILVNKKELSGQYRQDKVKLEDGSWEKVYLPAYMDLEGEEMCRVYTTKENRVAISKLKPRTKELYFFILYQIDYNLDWIWLNRAMYMKECGVGSVNTFISARDELIEEKIIQVTVKKDVFYVNPKYFFKGNRIIKYPNNVIEKN